MAKVSDAAVAIVDRQEHVATVMARVEIITAKTRVISAKFFVLYLRVLDNWTPFFGRKWFSNTRLSEAPPAFGL